MFRRSSPRTLLEVQRNPKKILLVDDDEVVADWTAAVLESAGFEVSVRTESFGTSATVMVTRPDLVLMDVDMPGLKGTSITEILRHDDMNLPIPVVLYSGKPKTVLQQLAAQCQAAGSIEKSGDPGEFLASFNAVLDALAA